MENLKQIISFLGVGVIATLSHYALLITLVEVFDADAVAGSVAGAALGALVSYVLNRNYTFNSELPHSTTMPKFFAVAGLAMISNFVLMKVFVDYLLLPYLVAQVITTVILIAITFGLNKIWSFRDPARVGKN